VASVVRLHVLDGKGAWFQHISAAAERRGWEAIDLDGHARVGAGYGFVRPHPARLEEHRALDAALRHMVPIVQDRAQVEVYEDKSEQFRRWGSLMPDTWLFDDVDQAMAFRPGQWPIVSKANEGASSVNVRILYGRRQYEDHVRKVFGPGVEVSRCADGARTIQRGYLLLQQFIPHDRTYRVNIIGRRMAIFERFNYPDRPVAQTGNTKGVIELTDLHHDLLAHAKQIGQVIGSRWVALDILRDGDQWRLLETSLAWPWDPAKYVDVPFIEDGRIKGRWGDLWDVLCEELADGAFAHAS